MKKNSIFVFLIIILLYLDTPLFIGNFMLPSIIGVVILIFFSLLNTPHTNQLKCFLALETFLFSYFFFGPDGYNLSSFISSQQLVAGVMLFSYLILYIKKIPDKRLLNIFAFTIISIAFLSQLEVYTSIKELSDSFRNWAYGNTSYLYDSDKRDLALVGNIRPKVFAPEPSTHTILLSCLLLCYRFIKGLTLTVIDFVILILCVAVYFATLSPSLFLAIILYILLSVNWLKNLPLKMIPVFFSFIILVVIGGIELNVFSRFYSFGDINEVSSVNVRVLYPILTMQDVIQHYPLFGIGIGNKEELVSISSFYAFNANQDLINENILLGSFALARMIIYFGLLGTLIFLLIIFNTVLTISFKHFLRFSTICFILVFSLGTFESMYFWFLLAISYRSSQYNEARN